MTSLSTRNPLHAYYEAHVAASIEEYIFLESESVEFGTAVDKHDDRHYVIDIYVTNEAHRRFLAAAHDQEPEASLHLVRVRVDFWPRQKIRLQYVPELASDLEISSPSVTIAYGTLHLASHIEVSTLIWTHEELHAPFRGRWFKMCRAPSTKARRRPLKHIRRLRIRLCP